MPYPTTPSSRPTFANVAIPTSRSASLWAAEIITRMRVLHRRTVGNAMAVPKTRPSQRGWLKAWAT